MARLSEERRAMICVEVLTIEQHEIVDRLEMSIEGRWTTDLRAVPEIERKQLGQLDGILHCAAMLGTPTLFAQSDAETWYKVHQVNLHAPYLLTRACLPLLANSAHASVVFMVDDKTGAYWDAYQVSKQGLIALARLVAREYADGALFCNCYNPGKTRTALQLRAYPAADENHALPLPVDHVDALLYLMSGDCSSNGEIFMPPDEDRE